MIRHTENNLLDIVKGVPFKLTMEPQKNDGQKSIKIGHEVRRVYDSISHMSKHVLQEELFSFSSCAPQIN